MHTVTINDLEANLIQIANEIIANGEEIQVTRSGKVILTVSPVQQKRASSYVPGKCAESVISVGDIITPIDNPNDWEYD